MNRREFLGIVGVGGLANLNLPDFGANFGSNLGTPGRPGTSLAGAVGSQSAASKSFGSGHFGEWITDQFGLPAYRYTCNQITDPKAVSPTHKIWRGATDQTHQVGNDRIVAAVSNFGYLQVRQDEGSPKFLNDYFPEQSRFGAGIGFLTDGSEVLSTFYSGKSDETFERIQGEGYFRKTVSGKRYAVDQVIFAPFGDDPVLISAVTVTNHGSQAADLRWVEYWGCQNHQFSFRSWMQAELLHKENAPELRREFADRFSHEFRELPNHAGLLESQKFQGRSAQDLARWEEVQAALKKNPRDSTAARCRIRRPRPWKI